MTIAELLSKAEFWSALFGALAAFVLGALATWWKSVNAKRTAGNLAIVTLSQMCSLMENLRLQLLVDAPILARERTGQDQPFSFLILGAFGLPSVPPRLRLGDLGFLADSRDPDILNRLLTIERGFETMLELVRRHERAHAKLQEKLNAIDPSAQTPYHAQQLLNLIGAKLFIDVDLAYSELQSGLPDTRDMLVEVTKQLRAILRLQFPTRRFVGFTPAARSRVADQPPNLPEPPMWRRVCRWVFDVLLKRRVLPWRHHLPDVVAGVSEPIPPIVRRFPPRSWDNPGPS